MTEYDLTSGAGRVVSTGICPPTPKTPGHKTGVFLMAGKEWVGVLPKRCLEAPKSHHMAADIQRGCDIGVPKTFLNDLRGNTRFERQRRPSVP